VCVAVLQLPQYGSHVMAPRLRERERERVREREREREREST